MTRRQDLGISIETQPAHATRAARLQRLGAALSRMPAPAPDAGTADSLASMPTGFCSTSIVRCGNSLFAPCPPCLRARTSAALEICGQSPRRPGPLQAQRTSQSTVEDLAGPEDVDPAAADMKAGGGVNSKPGFFGTITGGWLTFGVKPNCPAEKLCVPAGLLSWMRPSMTCTYRPGALEVGEGDGIGMTPWAPAGATHADSSVIRRRDFFMVAPSR